MLTSSIVIATGDRPQQLARCLAALRRNEAPDVEIVVVDSAPTRRPAEHVAGEWRARYIREDKPGASRSRNAGARAARGEVILFVDDDSLPDVGWMHALAAEFDDERVMAAAGAVRPPGDPESLTAADRVAMWMGLSYCGGPVRRVIDKTTPQWFEIALFGGIGIGPNMAVRRSAFDFWPGFDERLGPGSVIAGAEEPYAFFSLIDMGCRVAYSPVAVVRHPFPQHSAETLKARYLRSLTISTAYLAFLLTERPADRAKVLKYFMEGVCGKRRAWREQPDPPELELAPQALRLGAYLKGIPLGIRGRRHPC